MARDDNEKNGGLQALLIELERWLEPPMLLLSFGWLALVLVELIYGGSRLLETFGAAIWAVFVAEFSLRLWLAPDKLRFLKLNLLSLIALAAPALRMLRVLRLFRAVRAARGLRLVKVVGSANRGMRALQESMGRRGLGYVLLLSLLVLLLGAAGMHALEQADAGFAGYGDALWWTAMLMASLGTDYWPQSAEGRVLCFLIALDGLGVFGYITASFASFFVGRDAERGAEPAVLSGLREEIAALRLALAEGRRRQD